MEGLETMGGTTGRIAMHAGAAGVFFFVLQRFGLNQPVEPSLMWGVGFAIAAAGLAWSQSRR